MPRKLPNFPEEFMHEGARSLLQDTCSILGQSVAVPGADVCSGGVNQRQDCTGHWLRHEGRVLGFIITRPYRVADVQGHAAVRGWIWPDLRCKGAFSELMREAGSRGALVSDPVGMTVAAHDSWLSADGFSKAYVHAVTREKIAATAATAVRCFGESIEASQWFLVLTLVSSESPSTS